MESVEQLRSAVTMLLRAFCPGCRSAVVVERCSLARFVLPADLKQMLTGGWRTGGQHQAVPDVGAHPRTAPGAPSTRSARSLNALDVAIRRSAFRVRRDYRGQCEDAPETSQADSRGRILVLFAERRPPARQRLKFTGKTRRSKEQRSTADVD